MTEHAGDGCAMDGAWQGRRRGAVKLPNVEIERRVKAETVRALTIASMRRDLLVAYVGRRMTSEHMAGIPRSRVRDVISGMILDGTVVVSDAERDAASGVGCPCCFGGSGALGEPDDDGDGGERGEYVLRLRDPMETPASHAMYCLLSAWQYEFGIMEAPGRKRLLKELCKRGGYDIDIAGEALRLLLQWRLVSERKDKVAIVPTSRRRPA